MGNGEIRRYRRKCGYVTSDPHECRRAPAKSVDRDAFRRESSISPSVAGAQVANSRPRRAALPYFFNAGLFCDATAGRARRLRCARRARLRHRLRHAVRPAYKGITLAAATAVALAGLGHNVPFCFNRKEAKDHGEGGNIVGAPLAGRALIVDDVITDGASKREAIEIIRAAGATAAGVLIALDRQERGQGELSATQEVSRNFALPVTAIATLEDVSTAGARPESGQRRTHRDTESARRGIAVRSAWNACRARSPGAREGERKMKKTVCVACPWIPPGGGVQGVDETGSPLGERRRGMRKRVITRQASRARGCADRSHADSGAGEGEGAEFERGRGSSRCKRQKRKERRSSLLQREREFDVWCATATSADPRTRPELGRAHQGDRKARDGDAEGWILPRRQEQTGVRGAAGRSPPTSPHENAARLVRTSRRAEKMEQLKAKFDPTERWMAGRTPRDTSRPARAKAASEPKARAPTPRRS